MFRNSSLLRLVFCLPLFTFCFGRHAIAETSRKEALLTQLVRDVNVIEASTPARRARLNERVGEGTGIRTGGDSRAELTFVDLTITRLGANSLYSFRKAGRHLELNSGSTLLRVPKNSGGATIVSPGITAGISGTTVIFEFARGGDARLTVLEGTARLTLTRYSDQSRNLRAGQALQVPASAARIPEPTEVDLDRLMKTSPLIVGFRPLPSQGLINQAIKQQREQGPLNQNQPNRNSAPGPQNPAAPPAPPPGPRR